MAKEVGVDQLRNAVSGALERVFDAHEGTAVTRWVLAIETQGFALDDRGIRLIRGPVTSSWEGQALFDAGMAAERAGNGGNRVIT